jgi:hypothetical protein
LIRGLLAVVVAAGAAVTCDAPTGPARHMVALALQPVLGVELGTYGLSVDQARLIVVRPPADTVATQTFTFSPDSAQITANVSVPVADTATFDVTIQLLSGGTVMFTGVDTVLVSSALPSTAAPVTLSYQGPGLNIASILIAPRDSGLSFGGSLPYTLTAQDSAGQPVSQFYAAWRSGNAANTINAVGLLRAGRTRGTSWVYAHALTGSPAGAWDSTRVTVSPVPSQVQIISGNNQSGTIGTVLAQPLVVKVLAADNLPVGNVTVQFSASSGSANPPSAMTDSLGLAQTIVTLGNTAGAVAITAKAGTAAQAQFAATATQLPGVPAVLAKVAGDAQSVPAGTAVPVLPQVKVTDAFNTPLPSVPVTFAVASGAGSITGATTTTNSSGLATVGSWTLGTAAGVNTLTASSPNLTPVTFTATGTASTLGVISIAVPGGLVGIGAANLAVIKLVPAAPAGGVTVTVTSDSTKYVTVAAPGTIAFAAGDTVKTIAVTGVAVGATVLHATASGYTAGLTAAVATPNFMTLTPLPTVGIGRSTNVAITLSQPAPPPYLVVTLGFGSDTTKIKFVKGSVANPLVGLYADTIAAGLTSGSVTMEGIGVGVTALTAVSTTYAYTATIATVNPFPGSLSLVSGGGQSGGVDSLLPQAITVKVDSAGLPVSGYLVNFAVASGGGSVLPAGINTDAAGQAAATWTLGPPPGQQSITATALGASGSPLTITATAIGQGIASTTVTPKLDTITAINGTFTLVAQAKNASGGNLTGSYTWTSRTPAIATVNTAGVVTGLANGSTWVVATEAGGTNDSAQIVVQQKLASITVTPANKNLYLTTSFTFTAQAVDGLGTPLPANPSFNWSTTAPAVASVDTSNHTSSNLVNTLGLGTAQIKATSGTITGVGNLSVITAITRIAVVVDTVGAAKTDTFSLPSLGITRRYRAIAHDTLDAVMPAVTQFTWASTNPSVAGIPNQTSDTATATSAANGVTTIKATAQGFTSSPGALLTVSQVLASIQLSPASATVAVSGSVPLTARGLDANSRYISGGTFTFVSKFPGIATVGAATGVVTGVSIGTDTVTADSGAIVSNPSAIVVSTTVPAAISFGRDTVSVGRGSSASIPILLSTPVPVGGPGALIIKLGVSPAAYAHWSTPTVSIPQGGTSVNATLVGDSAGTTSVTAADSSGLGYAAAGAVAKVTANMSLASGSYAINATDIVTTQVLLSDPSPVGGTYVTFTYGTPGIAAVSPNPAFIPAGQLAADIQINALAGGTTTITPNAIGVNGAPSNFTAYPPVLRFNTSTVILGLGQYQPNVYVYSPTNQNLPIPVTLTSSDTTVGIVTPTVTIPGGTNYVYFTVTSTGLGTATVTPSATGWTAGTTITLFTTTPRLATSGGGTIYTTSGIQNVTVYAEDSTFNTHLRVNSLLVNLRSSDTTVMKVIDTVATINPGAYYVNARVTPGPLGGVAYIVATASGHTPDSVRYTVNGPPLNFNWGGNLLLAVGTQDINRVYVYVPNSVLSPLVVRLTTTDATKVGVPDSVIIPTGTNYVYFNPQGLATGTVTFTATAPGYQTATGPTYTVTSPAIILNTTAYTLNNFNGGPNFNIYSADTTRGTHYRITPDTVTVTVRDTTIARVDSATAIIPAGQYYTGSRRITPVGIGSTYLVVTAPGQVVLDSLHIVVNTPLIQISFGSTLLGRRQHMNPSGNGFYIYTPDSRSVTVPATMAQKQPTVDSLSTLTPTIPSATNYVYLDAFGLSNGTDTISVSATGYNSGNPAYITITTPRLTASGLPGSTTTTNLSAIGLNVYAADSVGNIHYTMDTVTVHAVSSDTTVIKPDSAYYHILKNAYYAPTSVHVFGPGSANVTFTDSANSGYTPVTTNTMTVTGPSLLFNSSSTMLGMRQTTGPSGIYVYTQNTPATPQVVHLKSTDTLVVTVPDSVIIPTTANYVYFPVNAMDTLGTIQVQATATGFSPAAMSVQVTRPKFVISTNNSVYTTSSGQSMYIYAEDQNSTTHYTTENVVVTLASSATSVATIDSTTVTIPAGQYYVNTPTWSPNPTPTPGTAQLTATDTRAALYAYTQATFNVSVVQPSLNFNWGTQTLGIGQYNNQYVYTPNNAVAPIDVALAHTGTARTSILVGGTPVSTVTIPVNTSYVYFHIVGSSVGMDTLVATTANPPHFPGTGYSAVSLGQVNPLGSWPSTLSLTGTDSVQFVIYARDSATTTHYVQDSTTFTLAPNANIQFVSGGANSAPITSVVIPRDQYYVYVWVKGVSAGTGQATISATNYVTYQTPTITVSP